MSPHLSYDAPWPVRKVPLRCTPHFVAYHLESKTYAVVTSTSETTTKVWKFNGDDKELVEEERDERFPWPTVDSFSVQLYSPMKWEAIPGTKIELDNYERCTGMKHLYLTSEGLHSGEKGYIVVGKYSFTLFHYHQIECNFQGNEKTLTFIRSNGLLLWRRCYPSWVHKNL